VVIDEGNCAALGLAAIHDVAACEEAASHLGQIDVTLRVTDSYPRPFGCFLFGDASQVWMGTNSAGVDVNASEIRRVICGPRQSSPVRLAGGSCEGIGMDTIHSKSTCTDAAVKLGLQISDVVVTNEPDRPAGCHWFTPTQRLFLGTGNASGASNFYMQKLCSPPANTSDPPRTPPLGSPFKKIASGVCADHGMTPIHDIGMCEVAASELGLPDATPLLTNETARPWGCFWYSAALKLWMGTNVQNQGSSGAGTAASSTREIICGSTATLDFARIAAGTCADIGMFSIRSASTCEDAIAYLGLQTTSKLRETDSKELPEGCQWYAPGNQVWLARRPSNIGSPATYYRHLLCSRTQEAYKPPQISETWYFGQELPSYEKVALDAGAGFGKGPDTSDGLTYGWNCAGDTDVHFQWGRRKRQSFLDIGKTNIDLLARCKSGWLWKRNWKPVNWEVALPNGDYNVEVIFPGDDTDGCEVEGEPACASGDSNTMTDFEFCKYQKIVKVSDGRLTVTGFSYFSKKCKSLAKVSISSAP